MTNTQRSSNPGLTRAGIARLVTVVFTLTLVAATFFLAAGTLEANRGWLYYGGVLAYLVLSMAAIVLFFPQAIETVNARGMLNRDVKTWDKIFGLAFTLLLLVQPAAAGWDVRRRATMEASWLVPFFALFATIAAYSFVHWAMIVNKHAETGVRIQVERDHAVISTGPYAVVRHPFNLSLIVTQLVYPLALGSATAAVPSFLMVLLLVWRTAREDKTLRRELPGYEEFTKHTRYRLFPGLW